MKNSNLGVQQTVHGPEHADRLIEALQQALHGNGNLDLDILALAAGLHQAGQMEAALRAAELATQQHPENLAAWHALAAASMALKLPRKALQACNRALALDTENPDSLFNTGAVLRALGDLPAALHCYEKAISLDHTHYGALRNRPLVLAEMNRGEEARLAMADALGMYPGDAWLRFNAGELSMAFGEAAAAVDAYEKALAIDPALHPARHALTAALAALADNPGGAGQAPANAARN